MNVRSEDRPTPASLADVSVPRSRPNFNRRLVCILGLPFDAMTLDEAVERVRHAAFSAKRCFVSTPNLNFAIAARTDSDFRGAVLRSDLSLVDGMPLVWIARLLAIPVPMRVAGADLFEALVAHSGPPVSIFLFGGPPGAAAAACERINRKGGGIRCAGFESPGAGSVESMSSPAQIEHINRSGAQFVVVALGAKKGQAWIEANVSRLHAPVLSHLGAVLNFAAGSVRRAPPWMQRCGLEWLWRIREEPALWRRYGRDGLVAARLLMSSILPELVRRTRLPADVDPTVEVHRGQTTYKVVLRGTWGRREAMKSLAHAFDECVGGAGITVDVAGVIQAGNALAALLLVGSGWFEQRGGFRVVGKNGAVARALQRMGVVVET